MSWRRELTSALAILTHPIVLTAMLIIVVFMILEVKQ